MAPIQLITSTAEHALALPEVIDGSVNHNGVVEFVCEIMPALPGYTQSVALILTIVYVLGLIHMVQYLRKSARFVMTPGVKPESFAIKDITFVDWKLNFELAATDKDSIFGFHSMEIMLCETIGVSSYTALAIPLLLLSTFLSLLTSVGWGCQQSTTFNIGIAISYVALLAYASIGISAYLVMLRELTFSAKNQKEYRGLDELSLLRGGSILASLPITIWLALPLFLWEQCSGKPDEAGGHGGNIWLSLISA